jgi:hypothetical protein
MSGFSQVLPVLNSIVIIIKFVKVTIALSYYFNQVHNYSFMVFKWYRLGYYLVVMEGGRFMVEAINIW